MSFSRTELATDVDMSLYASRYETEGIISQRIVGLQYQQEPSHH